MLVSGFSQHQDEGWGFQGWVKSRWEVSNHREQLRHLSSGLGFSPKLKDRLQSEYPGVALLSR